MLHKKNKLRRRRNIILGDELPGYQRSWKSENSCGKSTKPIKNRKRNPDESEGMSRHITSEELALRAKKLLDSGSQKEAFDLYLKASEAEEAAFNLMPFDIPRTRGVSIVRAVSLAYDAKDLERVKNLCEKYLRVDLPDFARIELEIFLQKAGKRRKRRNPDPDGNPWGPTLYNPLVDTQHPFKDESHYNEMISKLRRNPYYY